MKNYLFDLDGTIIDSGEGVTKSIQYSLKKMGWESIPEKENLYWCIGPPLRESFKKIVGNNTREVEYAIKLYRDYYKEEGLFLAYLYDGIEKLLQKLVESGNNIYLATSKPLVYAEKILEHFDISGYFNEYYGNVLSGKDIAKPELISNIINNEKLQKDATLMIGDRAYDINGACLNNLKSCGVIYGYGSRKELMDAGADFLVKHPGEILNYN